MSMSAPFLILLVLILTGCSGSEVRPEPETALSLTINAGHDSNSGGGPCINSSLAVDAAPLQLRMYELQSTELFANADFLDIYLKDVATLQGSLVKKHQLPTVWPNTSRQLSWQLDRATRFIAIFAEFTCYQSSVWSVLEAIVPQSRNSMILQVHGNHLRLSVGQLLAGTVLRNLPEVHHGSQL